MFPRLVAAATVLIALLATPASSEQTPLSTGNDHDPYSDGNSNPRLFVAHPKQVVVPTCPGIKFSPLPYDEAGDPHWINLQNPLDPSFTAYTQNDPDHSSDRYGREHIYEVQLATNHQNRPLWTWAGNNFALGRKMFMGKQVRTQVTFTNDDASKKVTIMRDAAGLASYMSANETMTSWNTHSQCIEGCGRSGSLGTPGCAKNVPLIQKYENCQQTRLLGFWSNLANGVEQIIKWWNQGYQNAPQAVSLNFVSLTEYTPPSAVSGNQLQCLSAYHIRTVTNVDVFPHESWFPS
ncbi:SubName: Full=Uncharacterized protein {ECO:0000313/EMBL:CCA71569.1} [Serendipita indica DSM 11827]|nr:SubName: Full=Uncharacterized protein {ECO:0000313/EMBL:CCA71569.1} [Serendipita indica DSM 11827]